jgi:predicted secreted hydrolase
MNVKVLIFCLLPGLAAAQGYAGLGTSAEGFAEVTPPARLEFPADHGPHPEYRIEWWYLTAALQDAEGRDYGVQWTLFRQATEPGPQRDGWVSQQIWMGHAGLTTADAHFHAERFARGGIGQAGVELDPFRAWIDDWQMAAPGDRPDEFDALRVTANGDGFAYALEVTAEGPLVLNGEDGFSLKAAEGQASYYYSQPTYRAEGVLTVEGAEIAVTGTAWLDREWSSQHMSETQEGWDWFALHLDDGARLMAYRLRSRTGPSLPFGTWLAPDGTVSRLGPEEIVMEPRRHAEVAGRQVPVDWRLEVPPLGLSVDTEAVNPLSWTGGAFPYWEGPIRVTGSHPGRGYLEMTGY